MPRLPQGTFYPRGPPFLPMLPCAPWARGQTLRGSSPLRIALLVGLATFPVSWVQLALWTLTTLWLHGTPPPPTFQTHALAAPQASLNLPVAFKAAIIAQMEDFVSYVAPQGFPAPQGHTAAPLGGHLHPTAPSALLVNFRTRLGNQTYSRAGLVWQGRIMIFLETFSAWAVLRIRTAPWSPHPLQFAPLVRTTLA
jgi:hypothetical protein